MIIDSHARFSVEQVVTVDAISTNVYDTGASADQGAGAPLKLFCTIPVAFDNLTTLNVSLYTDSDEAFGSPKTLWTVPVALARLTLNAKIDLPPVPPGAERYLALYYDVVGTAPSVGKITAGIVLDDQKNTPTTDFQ